LFFFGGGEERYSNLSSEKVNLSSEKVTQKELIAKIKQLKQIQPNQDWVILTKAEILREKDIKNESVQSRGYWNVFVTGLEELKNLSKGLIFRPAFATISIIGVLALVAIFGCAQNSLPGDVLYPVKKITEKAKIYVLREAGLETKLELTNERLKELSEITQTNQVRNLAFALQEYKTAKIEVEEQVSDLIKQSKNQEQAVAIAKKVAPRLKAINEKEKEVFTTLGIEPEEQDNNTDTTEKTIVELLIKDLSSQTLTEDQQEILTQAQELFENQQYQQALIKILSINQNQF